MKNNINYFTHDVHSFEHHKFKTLRIEYWWEGYWKFWALNEMIWEAENCILDLSRKSIKNVAASDLHMKPIELDDFINYLKDECELIYEIEEQKYTTERIQDVLNWVMKTRSRAKVRYEKKDQKPIKKTSIWEESKILREENKVLLGETIESKVNKNKIKYNNKELLEISFENVFWRLYPRKDWKKVAQLKFTKLKISDLHNLYKWLLLYRQKWKTEETDKQFIPMPWSWLNQERWVDEIVITGISSKSIPRKRETITQKERIETDRQSKASEENKRIKKLIEDVIKSLPLDKKIELEKIILENVLKKRPNMKWKEDTSFIKPLLLAERHLFIKEKFNIK